MKRIRNTYKQVMIVFVVFALCLTTVFSVVLSNVHVANAANFEESTEIHFEEIAENKDEVSTEIKAVLNNNITETRYLYNYDGAPDYVYVELREGGYAVFANGSDELLEYSPNGSILENYSDSIVYGGPANYYVKENNVFTNIITEETFTLEKSDIISLSDLTREVFSSNSISDHNRLYSSNMVTDEIEDEAFVTSVPPLDENNLISPTNGALYIAHKDYFLANPTHGDNNGTSCTTVAAQLMLSYNNYYNDRRLIPDKFLNGTETLNPQNNPNYCPDPMLANRQTLGSNQAFHDYLFNKGVTGFPKDSKGKLNEYLEEQNANFSKKIGYTITCEDTFPNVVSTNKILAELNANRPVVISTAASMNGTDNGPNRRIDHSVLAYGYQYLAPYNDGTTYLGYVVHFGWTTEIQIWTNSAWYYTYMSLQLNHTHNYDYQGTIGNSGRSEYKCLECGHRTDKAPNTVYLDITNEGKIGGTWQIKVKNLLDTPATVYYNSKRCFLEDAKNWTGLTDVNWVILSGRSSTILQITENAAATSVALSYIQEDFRYTTYGDQLTTTGGICIKHQQSDMHCYIRNNMKVSIAGKKGNTWLILLKNCTGGGRTFYYNAKMCYAGDAENWTGLADETNIYLATNAITSEPLEISENASATSIAISYKIDVERYIFYAYDLNTSGTMTSFGNVKPPFYSQNGITACIVSKSGNTWTIKVTNNTGSTRDFYYNKKMCYAGDAEKWSGLSDPGYIIDLPNGWSQQIEITENYSATSIAISYMDGVYRKIFYAYSLNATTGTMSAFASTLDTSAPPDECLAEGSLITLADGSQKAVEELTGDELLLVWNMETGTFDTAPIIFIDSDLIGHYEIIDLGFSDGTSVEVIYEHGFWDVDLNKYVYLDGNAAQYIGHRFNKQTVNADGSLGYTEVTLTDVEISVKVTTAWSPVTYGHLCYYVNGMLSMPGGITGLINYFEVNPQTMQYDLEQRAADLELYGEFTYEDFADLIPEEIFDAFGAKYLKVSIGKGLITWEQIETLIARYASFFI